MTNRDIQFLAKQTKLSEAQVIILLEDDASLVLENTPKSDESISTISFPLFVRHTVLSNTKDKSFTITEKEYVADSIILFPTISTQLTPYVIDKQTIGETEARYYLILLGLFPQVVNKINSKGGPDIKFYGGVAQQGFKSANLNELAEHTFEWITTLRSIKNLIWH